VDGSEQTLADSRGHVAPWGMAFSTQHLLSIPAVALVSVALACNGGDATSESSSETAAATGTNTESSTNTNTTSATDTTNSGETTGDSAGVEGLKLMTELGGLWSGPASQTPLGAFPLMNMDFRASDPRTLFGRVDLDAANSLRFGLAVETHGGEDVLVYRNGGDFLGIPRDSRTSLKEYNPDARTWRFCHVDKGCEYIDASFAFSGDDGLILDVKVKDMQHVYWDAKRVEARELPDPFPVDAAPVGDGDDPFPEMPTLEVDVQWLAALEDDGEVWVILTEAPCDLQISCFHSRSLRVLAEAGSKEATLKFDQIHPGAYRLNAILDRNGNMAETGFPDAGDGISAPNAMIHVAQEGESTAAATILIDL